MTYPADLSISDVAKSLPDMSDEELSDMYEDIQKDVARFVSHVGASEAIAFIKALLLEMADRKIAMSVPEEPPPTIPVPTEPFKTQHLNRKQRRRIAAQARKRK